MTEWLTQTLGETGGLAVLAIGALIIVLTLLIALMKIGRHFSNSGLGRQNRSRIGVVEAAAVDTKRRLILLRRDNREHLILTGGPNDLVIEANIETPRSRSEPMSPKVVQPASEDRPMQEKQAAPTIDPGKKEPALSSSPSTETKADITPPLKI